MDNGNEKIDEKETYEKKAEKLTDDLYSKLKTATFQYSSLSITSGMNLNEDYYYTFSGQFWNDDDYEDPFTAGWIQSQLLGDDRVSNETIVVPSNYYDGEISDINVLNGTSNEGDMSEDDENKYWLNSTQGYRYPATYSFEGEIGETGTDISMVNVVSTTANTRVSEIIDKHRDILNQNNSGGNDYFSYYFDYTINAGVAEFWFRTVDATDKTTLYFYGVGGSYIYFYIQNDLFKYYDNNAQLTSWTALDNTWYHIRVVWREELICDTVDIYSNGILKVDNKTMYLDGIGIDYFEFRVYDTTSFIDAWGESWDTNYALGTNYYWQYYTGYETFEEYSQSVNDGLYHGAPYNYNEEEIGENLPDWVTSKDNCTTIITDKEGHRKVLKITGSGGYYSNSSIPMNDFNLFNGTYLEFNYPATYSFYGEVGLTGTNIDFVDVATIPNNCEVEIISLLDNHGDVLKLTHDGGASDPYIYNNFDISKTSGTIEWWWGTSDTTKIQHIRFYDVSTICIDVYIYNNKYYYYDLTSATEISGSTPTNNILSHFKLVFDCNFDKIDLYIDNTKRVNQGNFNIIGTSISNIQIVDSTNSLYSQYIDAIGYSWDTDYAIGDNLYYENYQGTETFEQYNQSTNQDYTGTYNFNYETEQGYYYMGSEDFNDEPINEVPPNIAWIDSSSVPTDTSIKISSNLNGHNNILNLTDNSASSVCYAQHTVGVHTNSIYEFWWATSNISKTYSSYFTLREGSTQILAMCISTDDLKYIPYGGGYLDVKSNFIQSNVFFHVKIVCNDSNNKYDVYINSELVGNDLTYYNTLTTGVDSIRIYTGTSSFGFSSYIDAIGCQADDSYYRTNLNKNPYDITSFLTTEYMYGGNTYLASCSTKWNMSVESSIGGHTNVLKFEKKDNLVVSGNDVSYFPYYSSTTVATSGTVEFYWRVDQKNNDYMYIWFYDSVGNPLIRFVLNYGSAIKYYNSTSQYETLYSHNANQWYHIRVDFDSNSDIFDFYVDGVLIKDNEPYSVAGGGISRIWIDGNYDSPTYYIHYFDSFDFSWSPNYQTYRNTNPYYQDLVSTNFDDDWILNYAPNCGIGIGGDYNSHKKYLELFDNSTSSNPIVYRPFTFQTYGTVEFFMKSSDASRINIMILSNSGTTLFCIKIDADKFQYYDGAGSWHDVGVGAWDNVWYHIRIDFECTSGSYQGLSQYYWHLYINGTKYSGTGYSFCSNQPSANRFYSWGNNAHYNYYRYLDSLSFSWEDPIGTNLLTETEWELMELTILEELDGDYSMFQSGDNNEFSFYIDPNENVLIEWSYGDYTDINDYPDTNLLGDYITADSSDDGLIDQFGFTTNTFSGLITSISFNFTYSRDSGASNDFKVDFFDGNSWLGEKTISTQVASRVYGSSLWTGLNLNQTQINNLQVKLIAPSTISTSDFFLIYSARIYLWGIEDYINFTSTLQIPEKERSYDTIQTIKLYYSQRTNETVSISNCKIWNFNTNQWIIFNSSVTTTFSSNSFILSSNYYNSTYNIKLNFYLTGYDFYFYIDQLNLFVEYAEGNETTYCYIKSDYSYSNSDTIEFWWQANATNRFVQFGIGNNTNWIIKVMNNETSTLYYHDGTNWVSTGFTYSANTWYHFKISWTNSLITDKFSMWINGILYVNNKLCFSNISNVNHFKLNLYLNTVYLDAFGIVSDSNYVDGQNKNPYEEDLLDIDFDDDWIRTYNLEGYVYITGGFDKYKNVVMLVDNSTTNYQQIKQSFSNQISGSVEFWYKSPSKSGKQSYIFIGYGSSFYQVYLLFDTDMNIKYYDGVYTTICSYFANSWQHIKISFNCISDNYDVYINNSLKANNVYFLIQMDYLNYITFRTAESSNNYNISIGTISFSWNIPYYSTLDLSVYTKACFTLVVEFNFGDIDILELKAYRIQYAFPITNIVLYLFNFSSGLWYNFSMTQNTEEQSLISVYNVSNLFQFYNGTIFLKIDGNNYDDEFNIVIDMIQIRLFTKSLFSISKIFYERGVWKYRFQLISALLGETFLDWIYFDVVEMEPNLELYSDSPYTTTWDFITETDEVITFYEEDFIDSEYWNFIPDSGDRYFDYIMYANEDDGFVYSTAPTFNSQTYGGGYYVNDLEIVHRATSETYSFIKGDTIIPYYDLNQTGIQNTILTIYIKELGEENTVNLHSTDTDWDEYTLTYNNMPDIIDFVGAIYIPNTGWVSSSIGTTTRATSYRLSGTVVNAGTKAGSEEYGTDNYFTINFAKNYQGAGQLYMQTNIEEELVVRSPIEEMSLDTGYRIEVVYSTTTANIVEFNLLNDGTEVESYILSETPSSVFKQTTFLVSDPITFDQFEVKTTLDDPENVVIKSIKIYYYNKSDNRQTFYINPNTSKKVFLIYPFTYNLSIYDLGVLKRVDTITTSYDLQIYVYSVPKTTECYITFYDSNNEYLEFFNYKVIVNYTYTEENFINIRLSENHLKVDSESNIYFKIYDTFNVLVKSYSTIPYLFIDIVLDIYSLKIKNNAEANVNFSLQKIPDGLIKYGLLSPEELIEFSIYEGNYSLNYINYEDGIERNIIIDLTTNKIININTTYNEIYFALFSYDGLGVDPYNIRFYINSTRKDLGFNTITSRYTNLTVKDYFDVTFFQEIIDTQDLMVYNIYVEIYTLNIMNMYNNQSIKVNISRSVYWMEQIIPAMTSLVYRFIPNINYTVTARMMNDTIIETRVFNLTLNGHIESFGEYKPTEPPVEEVSFGFYDESVSETPDLKIDTVWLDVIIILIILGSIISGLLIYLFRNRIKNYGQNLTKNDNNNSDLKKKKNKKRDEKYYESKLYKY